jgi:biopolymer transport protein ExbB
MDFSLLGLWAQMGAVAKTVVVLLIVMSMYAIGIALERFVTFRRGRRRSLEYVAALEPMIRDPNRILEASRLEASWKDAPLARVLGAGLREFAQGREGLGARSNDSVEIELLVHGVGRSMDRAKKRELAALSRGMPALATIASSAPFVGLFGTVFGIITAFQQMADPSKGGGGGLATVSAGISEALLTTAVGLAVAIVAVWFYNFFTTRLDEIGNLIDDVSGELADRLLHGTRRAGSVAAAEALGKHAEAR